MLSLSVFFFASSSSILRQTRHNPMADIKLDTKFVLATRDVSASTINGTKIDFARRSTRLKFLLVGRIETILGKRRMAARIAEDAYAKLATLQDAVTDGSAEIEELLKDVEEACWVLAALL
ncbi:hypothetical protein AAMO2058_001546000 [Amorphochlora amoebiformis]